METLLVLVILTVSNVVHSQETFNVAGTLFDNCTTLVDNRPPTQGLLYVICGCGNVTFEGNNVNLPVPVDIGSLQWDACMMGSGILSLREGPQALKNVTQLLLANFTTLHIQGGDDTDEPHPLKEITIAHSDVPVLPTGTLQNMPNLTTVRLYNISTESIEPSFIAPDIKVTTLQMYENQIEVIKENAITPKEVGQIVISSSAVTTIKTGAIRFGGSDGSGLCVLSNSNVFPQLIISDSDITNIEPGAIQGEKVAEFYLLRNNIHIFSQMALQINLTPIKCMGSPHVSEIKNNIILTLQPQAFAGIRGTEESTRLHIYRNVFPNADSNSIFPSLDLKFGRLDDNIFPCECAKSAHRWFVPRLYPESNATAKERVFIGELWNKSRCYTEDISPYYAANALLDTANKESPLPDFLKPLGSVESTCNYNSSKFTMEQQIFTKETPSSATTAAPLASLLIAVLGLFVLQ